VRVKNQTSSRLPAAIIAATLLAVVVPTTIGQSNTLFGRRPRRPVRPAPTTQPAKQDRAAQDDALATAAAFGIRAPALEAQRKPKSNETLLSVSPFAVDMPEPEIIKVGDQITVIVRVSKSASAKSKSQLKKDWTLEGELSKWFRFSDHHGVEPMAFPQGTPAAEFTFKDDYKGDGKYNRTDELTTRIQAEVIDVKPNGNVVIQAANDISYGEEHYIMTLTGTCRSKDVTPENTVLSSQIAGLTVDVTDMGAVRDSTRGGGFKRALDFLRPF